MSGLVALDTETTGLDPDTEDVFEVATVDLSTGQESAWRIEPRGPVVGRMHPKAAEVNRYHERIAEWTWAWNDEYVALDRIAAVLDGAHIVGAVPDFDTRHLTSLYRRFGMKPPRWHYHLIDVENVAVGWLRRELVEEAGAGGMHDPWCIARAELLTPPWSSDDLAEACGIDPPGEHERHTALGDARWAARWYQKLTGGAA